MRNLQQLVEQTTNSLILRHSEINGSVYIKLDKEYNLEYGYADGPANFTSYELEEKGFDVKNKNLKDLIKYCFPEDEDEDYDYTWDWDCNIELTEEEERAINPNLARWQYIDEERAFEHIEDDEILEIVVEYVTYGRPYCDSGETVKELNAKGYPKIQGYNKFLSSKWSRTPLSSFKNIRKLYALLERKEKISKQKFRYYITKENLLKYFS